MPCIRRTPAPTSSSSLQPLSTPPSDPIAPAMFLQRSVIAAARRTAPRILAQRTFTTSFVRRMSLTSYRTTPELTELQATPRRRAKRSQRRSRSQRRFRRAATRPVCWLATKQSIVRSASHIPKRGTIGDLGQLLMRLDMQRSRLKRIFSRLVQSPELSPPTSSSLLVWSVSKS